MWKLSWLMLVVMVFSLVFVGCNSQKPMQRTGGDTDTAVEGNLDRDSAKEEEGGLQEESEQDLLQPSAQEDGGDDSAGDTPLEEGPMEVVGEGGEEPGAQDAGSQNPAVVLEVEVKMETHGESEADIADADTELQEASDGEGVDGVEIAMANVGSSQESVQDGDEGEQKPGGPADSGLSLEDAEEMTVGQEELFLEEEIVEGPTEVAESTGDTDTSETVETVEVEEEAKTAKTVEVVAEGDATEGEPTEEEGTAVAEAPSATEDAGQDPDVEAVSERPAGGDGPEVAVVVVDVEAPSEETTESSPELSQEQQPVLVLEAAPGSTDVAVQEEESVVAPEVVELEQEPQDSQELPEFSESPEAQEGTDDTSQMLAEIDTDAEAVESETAVVNTAEGDATEGEAITEEEGTMMAEAPSATEEAGQDPDVEAVSGSPAEGDGPEVAVVVVDVEAPSEETTELSPELSQEQQPVLVLEAAPGSKDVAMQEESVVATAPNQPVMAPEAVDVEQESQEPSVAQENPSPVDVAMNTMLGVESSEVALQEETVADGAVVATAEEGVEAEESVAGADRESEGFESHDILLALEEVASVDEEGMVDGKQEPVKSGDEMVFELEEVEPEEEVEPLPVTACEFSENQVLDVAYSGQLVKTMYGSSPVFFGVKLSADHYATYAYVNGKWMRYDHNHLVIQGDVVSYRVLKSYDDTLAYVAAFARGGQPLYESPVEVARSYALADLDAIPLHPEVKKTVKEALRRISWYGSFGLTYLKDVDTLFDLSAFGGCVGLYSHDPDALDHGVSPYLVLPQ